MGRYDNMAFRTQHETMNFYTILIEVEEGHGQAHNPYAAKTQDGEWLEGTISIDFLNAHFGQYATTQAMIDATENEGLKLFFAWLRDEGKLNWSHTNDKVREYFNENNIEYDTFSFDDLTESSRFWN